MAKKWNEGELSKTSRDKRSFGEKTKAKLRKLGISAPVNQQKFLIKPGMWVYSKTELKTDQEIEDFVNRMRIKYNC